MNQDPSRSLNGLLSAWRQAVAETTHPHPPRYVAGDVAIARFVEDSRQVQPGDCFVARRRRRHDGSIYSDGHPFIPQAVSRGATLVLGEDEPTTLALPSDARYLRVENTAVALAWLAAAWHGFPSQEMTIVGITGTDGKTTTANLLYHILRTAGLRVGLISTINAYIGDEVLDTGLHVSTPEAPAVQGYLRQMADAGLDYCILECTSHGLAQHRVSAIAFDVAIQTNITHEHLDYHGSWEGYFAAKARLFEYLSAPPFALPAAARKQALPRTAILNADDPSAARLATEAPAPHSLRYGLTTTTPPPDVTATDITYGPQTTRFTLHLPHSPSPLPSLSPAPLLPLPPAPLLSLPPAPTLQIASRLMGAFNVANMLAAAAAATVLGVAALTIGAGLEATAAISGRMERIDRGQLFPVIVDFAHTPNALEKAIAAARGMTDGRVIAVFGSAGKRDVDKRRLMAEIGARDADLVVLTAEDPRTESLAAILAAMAAGCQTQGGIEGESFWRVSDRGRAIYFALGLAESPADIVLICGKGHEQSMCFGTEEHPWDDRAATRAALDAFLAGAPMPDLGLPTFQADDARNSS